MRYILYTLTMPHSGSWDGKWTQEGKLHCVTRKYNAASDVPDKVLSTQDYYYDFGDGWGASISCSEISAAERQSYRRRSMGFCGYEWMVNEIEAYGRIKSLDERRAETALARGGKELMEGGVV